MTYIERSFSLEIEAAFKDLVQKNNIKAILFDLDDTLIATDFLFRTQVDLFFEHSEEKIEGLDLERFKERFRVHEQVSNEQMGVSMKHWEYVLKEMTNEYGDVILTNRHLIDEIYTSAPDLFEGVRETLALCKKAGLKLGVVTHAAADWTNLKLETHGLAGYFDLVMAIDPSIHRHKGVEHWKQAIQYFDIDPKEAVVVGDSLKSDINPAKDAGAGIIVWISNERHQNSNATIPLKTIVVDKIGDLIPALISE